MKFNKTYEYAKTPLTKKEYIKDFLEGLYDDSKCPTNLFDGLSIVGTEEYTETVGYFIGNVEADYTASVGYERIEQYEATESRYVQQGGVYKYQGAYRTAKQGGTYPMDVVKERKVIDWSPMSLHESYQDYAALNCESWKYLNLSSIFQFVIEQNGENFVETNTEVEIKRGLEEDAIRDIESRIQYHKANWPTDNVKDIRSSGSAKLTKNACFIVPCYKIDYTFEGKKFKSSGFAVEFGLEKHEIPEATNKENTEEDYENLFRIFERENNRIFKIGLFVGVPLLIIGLILLFIVPIVGLCVGFAGFLTIAATGLVKMIRYQKQRRICDQQRAKVRLLKAAGLKRYMLANGYTEQDFEDMGIEAKVEENNRLFANDDKKKDKTISVLFWVFGTCCVLGMLVNVIVAKAVWGFVRAMFIYPLYGYIAGFIVSGLSLIGLVILIFLRISYSATHEAKKKQFISFGFGIVSIIASAILAIVSYNSLPSLLESWYGDGTCVAGMAGFTNYEWRDAFTGKLDIPSEIDGKTVVTLGSFRGMKYVESVVVPNTVKEIETSSFEGCPKLKSIYIPSSVTKIGESAFDFCPNLTIFCEDNKLDDENKEWAGMNWNESYYYDDYNSREITIHWGQSPSVTKSW